MLGKPEWFTYRKFGWGLTPKTWQGWLYVGVLAFAMGLVFAMGLTDAVKFWVVGIVLGLFIIDVMHIMMQLPKVHDERENMHQLIIERNCSFAAIAALIVMMLFQTYLHRGSLQITSWSQIPFDLSIIVVLGAMLLTKIVSSYYVKVRM